eukprot:m.188033 g.188033  ORF g.188033 m.188033 type:complete len:74 (-) comp18519_c0_seq2:6-227(-)
MSLYDFDFTALQRDRLHRVVRENACGCFGHTATWESTPCVLGARGLDAEVLLSVWSHVRARQFATTVFDVSTF